VRRGSAVPAVLVVGVQALGALVAAVLILLRASGGLAVATGVLALCGAAALGLAARALAAGRRWPRSALLTVQLLGVPIGISVLQTGHPVGGSAVLVVALLTATLLVRA
jgi:hypothetical protein